jgi:hypothetical protein
MSPRVSGAALLLAALASPRLAAAGGDDDPKPPVEVVVVPKGRPWSIGRYGGQPCSPTCTLHVPRDTYEVTLGDAKETLPILAPAELVYIPGSKALRWAGLGMGLGGAGIGGLMLYLAARGCIESRPQGCTSGISLSRTGQQVLITFTGVLIATGVTGGILFAISGDGIKMNDRDPGPAAKPDKAVSLRVLPQLFPTARGDGSVDWRGAGVGVEVAF